MSRAGYGPGVAFLGRRRVPSGMLGGGRRDPPPKYTEKKKHCRTCRARTEHVYDHGLNRFICARCELEGGRGPPPGPPDGGPGVSL